MSVDFQTLRDADLFKEVGDAVLRELAQHCEYRELSAGATLFEQNTPGDTFYLLQTGQVHVVRQYPDGEQVILVTEGPYYVIGELSMLAGQPRTGAVVAVSDCTLIVLRREAFTEVSERMPDLAVQVMMVMSRRLYRMNLLAREYAIGNVAARVASVLLLLAGDENGPIAGPIRVSRVARAAATDADVVERLLQDWAGEGYLAFDGQQVTIHHIETLKNIAG